MDRDDILFIAYCNAMKEWKSENFPGIFWDWLKETYGVEIFFDYENRKIEKHVVSNENRFAVFILKHGSN